MAKLIVGFIALAAIGFYFLNKGGGDLDMGGEKHGAEATHVEAPAAASKAPEAASAVTASATTPDASAVAPKQ